MINLTSITIPKTVKYIGGSYTFATTKNVPTKSKLEKIESEMCEVFRNGLSTVYDIGNANAKQHEISAIALTKDGNKFIIDGGKILALNCRKIWERSTLIDDNEYSEYFPMS